MAGEATPVESFKMRTWQALIVAASAAAALAIGLGAQASATGVASASPGVVAGDRG